MRRTITWFWVIFLIIPSFAISQSLGDDPRVISAINLLEVWIDAERAYEQIPGISMGIVHDQELIWSRGFGYTDLDQKSPATPQTIYSICSISKLFTSIAVLQLRDQGKLSLNDPVSKHLPWFSIKLIYPKGPPITIRNILTHSSGLPMESDFPYWTSPEFKFPTREQVIERLSTQETLYPADTYDQYSNLGLTLAGEIVSQISGQTYTDYVNANIIEPLGLSDTRPELPEDEKGDKLATGYSTLLRLGIRTKLPFFQAKGIAPAAGFSSTVEDLARFASWQFRLLEKGDREILQANSLREMHRVHWLDPDWVSSRGLGFRVWRINDKTFVGHQGWCPGYRTVVMLQMKEKIAIIFMSNASDVDEKKYAHSAYTIVAPAIAEALESPKEEKPLNPAFQKYAGIYSLETWGFEIAVLIWNNELAMVEFPTNAPLEGIKKLKYIEGNLFRRILDDGVLGEKIIFEIGLTGKVVRMRRQSNYWCKIK